MDGCSKRDIFICISWNDVLCILVHYKFFITSCGVQSIARFTGKKKALHLYWALADEAQQIPAMAFLYLQNFTPFNKTRDSYKRHFLPHVSYSLFLFRAAPSSFLLAPPGTLNGTPTNNAVYGNCAFRRAKR